MSDENLAIKDVLRRDALSHGPWALRILDEIGRLEAEVERLRAESANAYELAETFRGKANAAADDVVPDRLAEELRRVFDQNNTYYAEIMALRGALQALVDATPTVGISDRHGFSEDAVWATHVQHPEALAAARAVAVAVLTGQEPTP